MGLQKVFQEPRSSENVGNVRPNKLSRLVHDKALDHKVRVVLDAFHRQRL